MDRMSGELDAFLQEMWEKFAHLARERVEALERYVAVLERGESDDAARAEAQLAAHKLVGALGSYHRPGSEDAARAERLVIEGAPVAELAPVVAVLRQHVS